MFNEWLRKLEAALESKRIVTRIRVGLSVPIVGFLAITVFVSAEKLNSVKRIDNVAQLTTLALPIGDLVHELQKERGFAAGYLSSRGKSFREETHSQRKSTDAQRKTLAVAIGRSTEGASSSGLTSKIEHALTDFVSLSEVRGRTDNLEVSVDDAIVVYSSIIAKLLAVIEEMTVVSSDIKLANAIDAYAGFLQGKERAGLERALGAVWFATPQINTQTYQRFIELLSTQEMFLNRFERYATPGQRILFQNTMQGFEIDEVDRMRRIILKSRVGRESEEPDPTYWFEMMTRKIDLLKKVEDRLEADLKVLVDSIRDKIINDFYVILIISIGLLTLTFVLLRKIANSITRPLDSLTRSILDLANGDTSILIDGTTGNDEISSMAKALDVFRRNAIELADVNQRMALAAEAAGLGVWDLDIVNNKLVWDNRMFNLYGMQPGEFTDVYEAWQQSMHPDDVMRIRDEVNQAMRGERKFDTEFRVTRSDGAVRHIKAHGIVVRNDDAAPHRLIGVNIDITERKHAEQKLIESECRFRHLAQTAGLIPWEADARTWEFTFVGLQAEQILGFPIDRWYEPDFWVNQIHPEDREASIQYCAECSRKKENYDFVYRMMKSDGGVIWLHDIVNVVHGKGGPKLIRGFMIDITERMQAQLALEQMNEELESRIRERTAELEKSNRVATSITKEAERARERAEDALVRLSDSEARIRAILDNMVDGVVTIDHYGIIQVFSSAAENMFGYFANEVIGQSVNMLMPRDVAAQHDGYLQQYTETGEAHIIGIGREVVAVRKDGTEFPAELAVAELQVQGERIYTGVIRDITERKKADEELRKSRHFLQSTLDGLVANIALLDRKGSILLVNRHWREFAENNDGRPNAVSEGINYLQICDDAHGEDSDEAKAFAEGIRRVVSGDFETFSMEYPCHSPSKERWMFGTVTPLRGNGSGYVVVSHQDITLRKQMEMDLANEKERAESANKAKSAFLATMSHEIRTPMNGVVGVVDLLTQTSITDEQKRLLGIAKESSMSLLQLINDILDFSKIEADQMSVERIPVAWTQMVESVAEVLSGQLMNRHLHLYCLVDPHVPAWMEGDPIRLRQILINLVGNAIKFTETTSDLQGEIRVEVGIENGVLEGVYELLLKVSDNGIGMEGKQIDELFRPFTQADSSTHRRFGGTGLGLSICSRLVELMDGEIGCTSELGVGSTFCVRLPCERTEAPLGAFIEADLEGLQILLLSNRGVVSGYLMNDLLVRGAKVTDSADLERAASILRSRQVDVVVLDGEWINDGRTQFRELFNSEDQRRECRFVVLVTDGEKEVKTDCPNSVFVNINPFRPSLIRNAIAVAAGRMSPETSLNVEEDKVVLNPPTVEEAELEGTLVLVAEDNPINQEVILRQLNLLGYAAEIAGNGQEALERLNTRQFGLVLTDCHMPEMDGFELTRTIRDRETGGTSRLPIVAITANALQGEADRCLVAGMDEYLVKPVEIKKLRRMLQRWVTKCSVSSKESPVQQSHSGNDTSTSYASVIDQEMADRFLGIDRAVQKQFLENFIMRSRPIIENLLLAAADREWKSVKEHAHKLKSSARAVGAVAISELCQSLEKAANERSQGEFDHLSSRLKKEWIQIQDYVKASE